MIYITGDCHADWRRFSKKNFPEQDNMTLDDFVIVCGDFGIWDGSDHERYQLNWLSEKNFNILFVDGNHENFDRLYSDEFEVVDFHGGKAHKIMDNIYHLMRGYVFDICGKKIFTFGGASSHDIDDGILDVNDFDTEKEFRAAYKKMKDQQKMFRVNHVSWWKEEMPTQDEMEFGMNSLDAVDNEVDFIVTHCCPQQIASLISRGMYKPDQLTSFFNVISETVDFKKWFFGHYHDNMQIMSKFIMLYDQIIRIA